MSGVFPSSGARWGSLLLLWLGGLVGYLICPVVWLVAGPFRWLSFLAATGATESGFNCQAQGAEEDGTTSYGVLQFNSKNLPWLFGPVPWSSPFWQGIAAARYTQTAILSDWRWLTLRIPFYGFNVFRLLWRGGIGSASRWTEASAYTEDIATRASFAWSLVFLLPSLWFTGWLFGLWRRGRR